MTRETYCCECDEPTPLADLVDLDRWFCGGCWPTVRARLSAIRAERELREVRDAATREEASGARAVLRSCVDAAQGGGRKSWAWMQHASVLLGNAALDVLEHLGFDRHEELRRAGAEGVNDE